MAKKVRVSDPYLGLVRLSYSYISDPDLSVSKLLLKNNQKTLAKGIFLFLNLS